MSERSAPMAPTASRIQPIVCTSRPLTVAWTAQIKMAPAAISTRLTPIPMCSAPFRRCAEGKLLSCRENGGGDCLDTAMEKLLERRAHLCRLTPDRALESPEEAWAFLQDRGVLTRTPDSALPSLFAACHEEPYKPGSRGFGSWPRTKWPWYSELAAHADVHELKVHNGKSILFTDDTLPL